MNIGDRVIATEDYDDNIAIVREKGTVIGFNKYHNLVLVEFESDINGHDGNGCEDNGISGRNGHCFYVPGRTLEPITEVE